MFILTHFVRFFSYPSSFISQRITTIVLSKTTYLDKLLVSTNLSYNNSLKRLYTSFTEDPTTQITTYFLPTSFLLQYEYQYSFSIIFSLTLELVLMVNGYLHTYSTPTNFTVNIDFVLGSYTSNTYLSFGINPLYLPAHLYLLCII